MNFNDIFLEKEAGEKDFLFYFSGPSRIKKKYTGWPENEIQREKKILSIPSHFIYHPFPTSDKSFQLIAPYFYTLGSLLCKNEYKEEVFHQYLYSWVLQATKSICDIHSNGFYHGKLSNESFYVNEHLVIGIGNIGYVSKKYTYGIHTYYQPPESYENNFEIDNLSLEAKQQYDVFSLCVLITEILTLTPYSEKEDLISDFNRMKSKDRNFLKRKIKDHLKILHEKEPDFEEIISLCLNDDPSKRMKAIVLFDNLKQIVCAKKDQYAISSLENIKQSLNIFEAMEIVPKNLVLESQIINQIINSNGYEYILDVIQNDQRLKDFLLIDIPEPLITCKIDEIEFKTYYQYGKFLTFSNNEFHFYIPNGKLFSMTLEDLFLEKNFIPNEIEILTWFLILHSDILNLINQQVPVCQLSLKSILVNFKLPQEEKKKNFIQIQVTIFPSDEKIEKNKSPIFWFYQYGILIEQIMEKVQKKINEIIQNLDDDVIVGKAMQQLQQKLQRNIYIKDLIWACLNINSQHEENDNENDISHLDKNKYRKMDIRQKIDVITVLLHYSIENSQEKDLIMNSIEIYDEKEGPLSLTSIFKKLSYLNELSEPDSSSYTDSYTLILKSLIYSLLDKMLPDECKVPDFDEMTQQFQILSSLHRFLYEYNVDDSFVSREIHEIGNIYAKNNSTIVQDIDNMNIRDNNTIVHEIDVTGLQVRLFRQYMISMVPKMFISAYHEIRIIVDDSSENSNSDSKSNNIVRFQDVIEFAQEMNIKYEIISNNIVTFYYNDDENNSDDDNNDENNNDDDDGNDNDENNNNNDDGNGNDESNNDDNDDNGNDENEKYDDNV